MFGQGYGAQTPIDIVRIIRCSGTATVPEHELFFPLLFSPPTRLGF